MTSVAARRLWPLLGLVEHVVGRKHRREASGSHVQHGAESRDLPGALFAKGSKGANMTCSQSRPSMTAPCAERTSNETALFVSFGSRPCENSTTFSHGPILFAFSSPQAAQNRINREKIRFARPDAKIHRVLTQPRSILRVRQAFSEMSLVAPSGGLYRPTGR